VQQHALRLAFSFGADVVTESTHKRKRGVDIRVVHGPAVMTEADVRAVEDLLVRLAVRRFVREHPEWFGSDGSRGDNREEMSGPPGAAAAVPSAPLERPGGPAEMELEHDRTRSEGTH
jgi:hypothetical protein